MDDYLYNNRNKPVGGLNISASFSGLTPNGTYRLLLYSASNQPRDTIFTVNDSSETVVDPGRSKVLQNGRNYADFTTTADAGGHLSFTVTPGTFDNEGDLNGIQLRSVASTTVIPEPGPLTLLGIGVVGLLGYGLRRHRRAPA
jgi:hypothetical protein